ncbi:MAG: T9SS type A sorting domain-containing protein, partial [Bacteroidetes bacterium]|nr:T9SS type A sorting domain-containing protein [Bacteroidota bacterium]
WSVSDDCGNSTSHTQVIEVVDNTAPEYTFVPADYTAECSDEHPLGDASATDNCGTVTITMVADTTAGGCAQAYTVVRTFTATDACGNSTTATQTITIVDTTAPSFNEDLPADMTADCTHPDAAVLTASDNCQDVSVNFEETIDEGSCPNQYTVTRTWSVSDDCGNSTSHTQVIEVVDNTAPVINGDVEVMIACEEYSEEVAHATASDNCGEPTLTWADSPVSGGCVLPIGQYVRLYTATDACGNSSTFEQILTLTDNTAPEFTFVPGDYTIECDQTITYDDATATDNCSGAEVSVSEEIIGGSCPQNYQIVRTFTATDNCDNSATATQTITVQDTTAPELSIPADYTIECDQTIVYDDASATDNCGEVTITEVQEVTPGNCAGNYTITREFTAEDECGNSTTLTQTITVQDTTAPILNVPADYTAECSDEHPLDDASATDNCGIVTITVVADTTAGGCAQAYTVVRTFTASDDCGNSTSGSQTITIVDTTAPSFNEELPADMTVDCTHPDAAVLTASDNCQDVSVNFEETIAEGSCPNQYTVTRTWSVSDDCGNSASHTQVIEVVDNTAPEFTFVPSDYTAECDEELVFDDASATDNCGSVTVTVDEVTNETECAQEYSIVRTFTATDACGNSSTATQTITVQDTTAPVITNAGGLMNGETVEVCCEAPDGTITIPAAVDVTFTDNCDADATQTYTETCVGDNCPTETVDSWCDITTPEVMPDGETCDNYAPHSLRLFNFAGAEFYTTVEGRVANNSDGTKTYTMTVVASDNANAGWTITNHYGAPMTWQEWIDQPGNQSYKSDCGIGDHTTWMYTTLTSGSAEGWGDYAGSSLSFSHQPASGYFGFQIGEGANNKNGNYGFSAWMYYNGTFDGSAVAGSGDVFGDLDCCLPYDLEREYVMTDCAGNTTTFHYTVSMTGEGCSDEGDAGISDEEDAVLTVAKDLIKIESLQPNPTSADAVLMLSTEEESITAQVVVLTMSGAQVLDVYNGPIVAGWNMQIDIPSTQLQSGMYQVQVRAKQFVTTKKLLVTN